MIKSMLCGLTIGGLGTLMAMQFHLVRTDERFVIVSRVHQPPMRSAYVDIRKWTPATWKHYPELQEAVIKAGREDLMAETKGADAAQAADSAAPFHDVSKSGPITIHTVTESRQQNSVTSSAPLSAKTTTSPTTLSQAAFGGSASANNEAKRPSAIETRIVQEIGTAIEPLQRSVPNPVEMLTAEASDLKKQSATSSETVAPNRGWMQNLIKNFVPGSTPNSSASESAATSPEGSALSPTGRSVIAESSSKSDESAAVVAEPVAEAMKPIAVKTDDSFPSSPRRIAIPKGKQL